MAIAHLQGLTSTNPYTAFRRVTLAHPDAAHSLLFCAFPETNGYNSSLRDWKSSEGRSLTGGLRVKGAGYKPPEKWKLNVVANKLMIDLFIVLLAKQNSTSTPVSLVDEFEKALYVSGAMNVPAWLSGYPVTGDLGYPEGYAAYNVWLDVDEDYKPYSGRDRYLLQFQALQA